LEKFGTLRGLKNFGRKVLKSGMDSFVKKKNLIIKIDEVLKESGLSKGEIKEIIMVGLVQLEFHLFKRE